MNEVNKEGALAFATCTTCYLNDFTCNAIKDAEFFLEGADKEAMKIYGAAKKRAKAYLTGFDKCIIDEIEYWANYCMFLDEESSKAYNDLYKAVFNFFSDNVDGCAAIYAIAEVLKMTITHNNLAIKDMAKVLKKKNIDNYGLVHDIMDDMERIVLNLAKWVLRKIPQETMKALYKDDCVEECRKNLCVVLISAKRHSEAKMFADKEREKNNGK